MLENKQMNRVFSLFLLVLIFFVSCKKEKPVTVEEWPSPTPAALEIPPGFPDMPFPDDNPMTLEGIALGRKLYYDDILSTNGLSCSSCHNQAEAFTTSGIGPNNKGILAHINLGWNNYYGWEGGEDLLDHVPLADLEEGNIFLDANNALILQNFEASDEYINLFGNAFGKNVTTVSIDERKDMICKALAQFIRTQISGNSRFDRFVRSEPGATFTQSEFNGYSIFFSEKGDCFHCHGYPLMTDNFFHNNGLDSVFTDYNFGRYNVTGNTDDIGKFKVPTLRNIELTGPYMHDNRFATLEEVIDFYNDGIVHSPTLDPLISKNRVNNSLNLTLQDKTDLLAFLKTLTDTSFTSNPELGPPL